MAKKKRSNPGKSSSGGSAPVKSAAASASGGVASDKASDKPLAAAAARRPSLPAIAAIPAEIGKGDWTVILLALMMFFAPAMGVPNEEMLQDTLKSIIVSFAAVSAALLFFWRQRNRREALRWHAILWIPIAWMAYALGSMVWSHTYLGGVEAIRWFVFILILWLSLNTLSREKLPILLVGIHCGAVVAALWSAMQFWVNFSYFPQGPNPASTFVNRNFIAEFLACTIPVSAYMLLTSRRSASIVLMALTLAFNVVVILMTGTRSALFALFLSAPLLLVLAWLYRKHLAIVHWDSARRILAIGVLICAGGGFGIIPTANPKMIQEHESEARGLTAFQRGFARAKSAVQTEEYTQRSFSVRLVMWKATMRIIQKRPITGVGAGAWEVDIPLYQTEGSQLETDYYVHNEILQLLAEYGLVGWITLLALLAYLSVAAWRTLMLRGTEQEAEAPLRAMALLVMFAFLIVSNAGFPWRLASTAAMFALALGILAASDARLAFRGWHGAQRLPWQPAWSQAGAVAMMIALALTAYISQKAAECEAKIVRGVKLALGVSQSGDPSNPRFDRTKGDILKLIKEGTDINPHYRKITPMVADEFAKWGDWRNAVWIWESVVSSRPYVVAILSNIARGYSQLGDMEKALAYLERAKKLQPSATSVRSLEVVLLSRTGKEAQALTLARDSIKADLYDYDMVRAAYVLGMRAQDWNLALKALEIQTRVWPGLKPDSLVKEGNVYLGQQNLPKAIEKFKEALAAADAATKPSIRSQIPPQIAATLPP
jgi:O-antigen ligase